MARPKKTKTEAPPSATPEYEFEVLIRENEVDVNDLPTITQTAIEKFNEIKNSDEPNEDKLDKLNDDIWNALMDYIEDEKEEEETEEANEETEQVEAATEANPEGEAKTSEQNTESNQNEVNTENTNPAEKATEVTASATAASTGDETTQSTDVKKDGGRVEPDTSKYPTAVKKGETKEEPKKTRPLGFLYGRGK